MYNHTSIWKNISMIIFLSILLIIFLILISSIKLEIYINQNGLDYNYLINIKYLFLSFSINKKQLNKYIESSNQQFPSIKKVLKIIDFEKLVINVNVGLIDILPTVLTIPIFGAIISMLMVYVTKGKKDMKGKFNFNVIPVYNKLHLSTKISCILKVNIGQIILMIIKEKIERRKKNGRTSNRRFNEHCYE